MNLFPYNWTAKGLLCKGGRRTQPTTTFEIFETHYLEMMGFLLFFFILLFESSLVYLFFKLMAYT